MNTFLKYAPLFIAVCWVTCFVICIIKPGNYRFEFMLATVVLIIMNIVEFWSDRNDRKVKRLDDES